MTDHIDLAADLARELTFMDVGVTLDGWTVVHQEDITKRRWVQVSRIVIRDEAGQHYAATYETGLTEYQDHNSFDGCETYPFERVVPRSRMVEVIDYVKPEETSR